MARQIRFRVLDGVAVVTLDAGAVNALSADVRAGLWAAFQKIEEGAHIKAAVLMATGQMFSGGTDIQEIGKAVVQPDLGTVCRVIEGLSKPVVAGLNGPALGGGAELALAAHYRVGTARARIGLPEVALGLVPAAGGTQRLPRLIGPDAALQMMMSSNAVDATLARKVGLMDGLIEGDLGSGAIRFAQALVASGKGPRPTSARRDHLTDARAYFDVIKKARDALGNSPLHAPQRIVDCVEAAALLPFKAGLAFEEDALDRCLTHPQSIALRHVFLAERRCDSALLDKEAGALRPVAPMGASVVTRLKGAMQTAADHLVTSGVSQGQIDAAMVEYGFRKGPYGGDQTNGADPAIARQITAAMMVEGATCVAQGAVQKPSDIDALAVHGLNYPRRRGGPMRATQTEGLIALRQDMRRWSDENALWTVPTLMDDAIKQAAGWDGLTG